MGKPAHRLGRRNVLLPGGGKNRRKGVQMDQRFEKDGEGGTERGRSPSGQGMRKAWPRVS
jgi:hypothetical protein